MNGFCHEEWVSCLASDDPYFQKMRMTNGYECSLPWQLGLLYFTSSARLLVAKK